MTNNIKFNNMLTLVLYADNACITHIKVLQAYFNGTAWSDLSIVNSILKEKSITNKEKFW